MAIQTRIAAIKAYVPDTEVSNETFERRYGLPIGHIARTTGLEARRHGTRADYPTAMGVRAAKRALDATGMQAADLDMIISAGTSRDQSIPIDAMVYAHKLGATSVQCLHVETVCLSFISALEIADTYIGAKRKRAVLVISSEQASRTIDYDDQSSSFLLADGAAAAILIPSDGESRVESIAIRTFADGPNIDVASIRAGGLRLMPGDAEFRERDARFHVDGPLELKLAIKYMPSFVREFLSDASLEMDDFAHIIPHQVIPRMMKSILAKMKMSPDTVRIMTRYGNMAAASMPVVMAELVESGELVRGRRVLLIGGAAGFSLGAAALVY